MSLKGNLPLLPQCFQASHRAQFLGPVLFLIYINDLPKYVSNSTVRLFADDTLLYLTNHNSSDCTKLQDDLNNLQKWESDRQMSFHPEKCEVIHITTKKYPIIHKYTLHGHILLSMPQIKYLGVHISQDLKWNSHINSISSKANQTLGLLIHNLKINSQTNTEKAYKSIVRPKLEYCSTLWDPQNVLKSQRRRQNKTQASISVRDGSEDCSKVSNRKVPHYIQCI